MAERKKLPKIEKWDIGPGDELYVGDSWSIDHGEDDMDGGIAVVKRVYKQGITTFVEFVGLGHVLNLDFVLEHQDEWEKEFGNRLAHDCPDVPGHTCPCPRRKCVKCDGLGKLFSGIKVGKTFVCTDCGGSGDGKIKRPAMVEAVKIARRNAFRSKLMRQSRREI